MYDVIVIGAGQAGLTMGYYLKKTPYTFLILDERPRIGDMWRERYDSLVLFTTRSYSSLHGLRMEGAPDGYPTKDELADYLEQYARTFDLPVQLDTKVSQMKKQDDLFVIHTQDKTIVARSVIVASGPFQYPNIPSLSQTLSKEIVQYHSSEYKSPKQLKDGPVLVVGGGNSGTQIAVELSETHEIYLSVGQKLRFLPRSFLNRSIFWWADRIRLLRASRYSNIGSRLQRLGDPIFGYELKARMKQGAIKLKGRTADAQDDVISFDDGDTLKVRNVIWATGFRSDYAWIHIPELNMPSGALKHDRGITNITGLMFLGLPWQHRRGSALLLGVGDDAHYLYQYIMKAP
ncbi:oxidoreductase [Paenibacillus albiflavus]|uniref:Oxidoreductase n=1 Tax=Paenibacillus albiflavus TaxID=2545760 RepID=A0A4R4E8M9_9BACL|nr:NAD(P)/FAD-dependent oxidoreductase [Paenibacillus albiflavus]TCZ75909.1 oxidoreductase [Paenibacillus albiflavus]